MATVTIARLWKRNLPIDMPQFPDGCQAITPADADVFSEPVNVYCGGAGNVRYVPAANGSGGSAITVAVVAGGYLPSRAWAVYATSTTATGLFAVYD